MRLYSLLLLALLSGCVSSSSKRIGNTSYPPLPPTTPVTVYMDHNEPGVTFEVIGIVSYDDPGKYEILDVGDAIEPLKQQARDLGANAIIIDQSEEIKSGLISTGIHAEARAIKTTP